MSHIQAIYRRGVFEPLEPVDLREEQRVQLSVGIVGSGDLQAWLVAAGKLRSEVMSQSGVLPDSSVEIAEDRRR